MAELRINVIGELTLHQGSSALTLPASRKTRALLAYLVVTARPHRRERLCELFWEVPDDPRASLRWSLSKLRAIVNDEDAERIAADRERVAFDMSRADVDVHHTRSLLNEPHATLSWEQLSALAQQLAEPLLDGIDLLDHTEFQAWLEAERERLRKLRAEVLSQLVAHQDTPADQAAEHAQTWLALAPFSTDAATAAVVTLHRVGEQAQARELSSALAARHKAAGKQWTPPAAEGSTDTAAIPATHSPLAARAAEPEREREAHTYLERQSIHFCTADDGVRIAYATVGQGATVVKAANWLSHLELDWDAPIWSPLFRRIARDHFFVRYDERGNGLSDWDVPVLDFSTFVTDLETVVDALELERFALLGISQGASVSIEYAARHPERVSHLILFGGYAAGWRVDADEAVVREREAMMTLTEAGWGR
ncbi:MAG: alpha/beta fold hydrolase, partial [Pseudomonadota bacterium]